MLELKLYKNFNKKSNSMAQPLETSSYPSYVYNVYLKEDTSIHNPTFLLTIPTTSAYRDDIIANCTYAKWDNKFYYVKDIIYKSNNTWEISCEIDLLATYRDTIIDTPAYWKYGGNNTTADQNCDDVRFNPDYEYQIFDTVRMNVIPEAFYSNAADSLGLDDCLVALKVRCEAGVIPYITNYENFKAIAGQVQGKTSILEEAFGKKSWLDYIISARFYRCVSFRRFVNWAKLTQETPIYLGNLDLTPLYGYPVTYTSYATWEEEVKIPVCSTTSPKFLRRDRWHDIQVKSGNGISKINTDPLYSSTEMKDYDSGYVTLKGRFVCDWFTGTCDCRLDRYTGKTSGLQYTHRVPAIYNDVFTFGSDILGLIQMVSDPKAMWLNNVNNWIKSGGSDIAGFIGDRYATTHPPIKSISNSVSSGSRMTWLIDDNPNYTLDFVVTTYISSILRKIDGQTGNAIYTNYTNFCNAYGWVLNRYGKITDIFYNAAASVYWQAEDVHIKGKGIRKEDADAIETLLKSGVYTN